MDAKQRDEMFWVERLKELSSDFPTGEIAPWKPDPPDVVVRAPAKIIGVEVRRLVRPTQSGTQLLQARENNCRRIVEEAKQIHEAAKLPPVRVSVFFGPQNLPSKEIQPLAEALAEIVRRNIPRPGEAMEEEYEYTNRDYFPEQIHLVTVSRTIDDDTWVAPEAAWNPRCESDYLQTAVSSKSDRYVACKQHCDEGWLLLVTDALGFLASYVDFADEALTATYTTPFDRLFLIHRFTNLHELRRKNP